MEENKEFNILIVIISCLKKNMLSIIRSKDIDNKIIVVGKLLIKKNYELCDDILYVNCSDEYEGLPEKIICALSSILKIKKFKNIKHILKIDDNEFIEINNIKNLYKIKELDSFDYIGRNVNNNMSITVRDYHFGKVNKNSYWYNKKYEGIYVPWALGGDSYILSIKAMNIINKHYNENHINIIRKTEIYEDLMIAKILDIYKIFPIEIKYDIF